MAVGLVILHFWFRAHAKEMLENMVSDSSNGKLKLKIGKLHFNYFSRRIRLDQADFYSTDTVNGTTAYRLRSERIDLKTKALFPLLFRKKVLIDSLRLSAPLIEVTRLRNTTRTGTAMKKEVSIPEEMGKVYTSIQDALQILKVKRFQIDGGVFRLSNRADPDQLPLTVSQFDFYIDNLSVDTARFTGKEKLLFSDNVVFRSRNQEILFPDGRHRLSFRNFGIDLKNKLVSFDSCTIAAAKTEHSAAAFNVYFDALFLSNIDFDTLYKTELIRADSVYCINPAFDLEVERDVQKAKNKRSPRLENIIQQLAGDLELGYVAVNNAAINIRTKKNNVPTSFRFSNNFFEVQGLSVRQDAERPIAVNSFAMAIRNYENFIKDSSYRLRFDSVLFRNDNLTLSNFIFTKLDHGRVLSSFSIPEFTLRGLSWDDLLFDRTLTADHGILYRPQISYTQSPRKKESRTIFQSLGLINEYMDLQQLDIVEGNIDLRLRNDHRLQLEDATLSVKSQSLLASKKLAGIRNSLNSLVFRQGRLHSPQLDIELKGTRYNGLNGNFVSDGIRFSTKKKDIILSLAGVSVNKMKVDEQLEHIQSEGLRWANAAVQFTAAAPGQSTNVPSVELKDIAGGKTDIKGSAGGYSVVTSVDQLALGRLEQKPGSTLQLEGLRVSGTGFELANEQSRLIIPAYRIADHTLSEIQKISWTSGSPSGETTLLIPFIRFTPDIRSLLQGKFVLGDVTIQNPVLETGERDLTKGITERRPALPDLEISRLLIRQPVLHITRHTAEGNMRLNWQGDFHPSGYLEATGVQTKGNRFTAATLQGYLSDFTYKAAEGPAIETGKGELALALKDIYWEQQDQLATDWNATLVSAIARNFRFDGIGKEKGKLFIRNGTLQNLQLGSANLLNIRKLAAENKMFRLQDVNGYYADSVRTFRWANAGFDRSTNKLRLDSFHWTPALSRDSFMARQSYQADYLQWKTGALRIGPVDIDGFIGNNKLYAGKAELDAVLLTVYKDRRLPFRSGMIKQLPVNALKKIRQPFAIDTVNISSARVEYTEVQEKTGNAVLVPVGNMRLRVHQLGNEYPGAADSLHLYAEGRLLDTVTIQLQVHESYADSLGGFRMQTHISPAPLELVNPLLEPLASVKVQSGSLDSFRLQVRGHEYLAWGHSNIFYRQLKIRFLQDSSRTKKPFLGGLKSFIANTFIIRKKNEDRNRDVFFTRLRDRSAVNYLVKITLDAVAGTVGVQNNKKEIRRYLKKEGLRNLPPVPID